MDENPLFRKEALEHHQSHWLGHALLIGRYPLWLVIVATCLFFFLLCLLIVAGDYTRRVQVQGEVTSLPRAVNIFSPNSGFIIMEGKQVGMQVKKGEPLYQIDVSRTAHSGNVSQNSVAATREQIKIIESIIDKVEANKVITLSNMSEQLRQYQQAFKNASASVTDARKGLSEMKSTMNDYAKYMQRGLINHDQMSNQRYLYYQQQNAFQNLNSQLIQQELQIINLKGDLITRSSEYDNQISQHRVELSNLQRQLTEMDASGTLLINAPVAGRIESLSVTQGQMVSAGDSLAQIVPADSKGYFLVLWLPDSSLPYVKTGDTIHVRYDAFPFEKFGQFSGKIMTISSVPASVQELKSYSNSPNKRTVSEEPFYKIIVDISADPRISLLTLTTGMKVTATLFLEKRQIYQWILSPLYDIYTSLKGPVS